MTRKVVRIQGDYGARDYIIGFGPRNSNSDRLVIGNTSSSGRRMRAYQTVIRGFGCDGPGNSLILNPGIGAFPAVSNVESIMFGHMERNGMIVWHRETERRA